MTATRRLKKHEVETLLDACGNGFTGARNRALIALIYRTGARCGEALSLKLKDYLVDKGFDGETVASVRIEKPKGYQRKENPSPPREMGLDPRTVEIIGVWLKQRGRAPGPLFCTGSGSPLISQYVRAMFKRLGEKAGLEVRVHAHALRHSFAHELYEESTHDVMLVKRALGHTRLDTTQVYLEKSGAGVVEATARREW